MLFVEECIPPMFLPLSFSWFLFFYLEEQKERDRKTSKMNDLTTPVFFSGQGRYPNDGEVEGRIESRSSVSKLA